MAQRFRVEMEFLVDRRVGWEGEQTILRDHLAEVVGHVLSDDRVIAADPIVDTETATLDIAIVLTAAHRAEAERVARTTLAAAIQESGAVHHGLLSLTEESKARPKLNAWSGLRTPQWRHRRLDTVGA